MIIVPTETENAIEYVQGGVNCWKPRWWKETDCRSLIAACLTVLVHSELHWLDIPQRVQYKLGVVMYRRLQNYYCASTSDVTSRRLCVVSLSMDLCNTLCSEKKHPLAFSFISLWIICGFKQKLQWIYPRNGRFWQCKN